MFDFIWFLFSERDSKIRDKKVKLSADARKGNVKAMGDLARICRETGDYGTSIKWYKKIVELGGENKKNALNNLGNVFYVQSKNNDALKYYEQASNLGLTIAKKNIGVIYQECEQWDAAIKWFRVAAQEGDQYAKSRLEILLLRPRNRHIGNWKEAEKLAQEWMFYFGFRDSKLSGSGSDGGYDVIGSRAIAQVKFEQTPTGRPKLQELAGEAHDQGKEALFFTLSGYTKKAIEWAAQSRIGIALFQYDNSGNIQSLNDAASRLLKGGSER